jgi:hypothetical protein
MLKKLNLFTINHQTKINLKVFTSLLLLLTISNAFAQNIKNYTFDTFSFYSTQNDTVLGKKIIFSESSNPSYLLTMDMDTKEYITNAILTDITEDINYYFEPKSKFIITGIDTITFKTQNLYEYISTYKIKKGEPSSKYNSLLKKVNHTKLDNNLYEIKLYKNNKKKDKNPETYYIKTQAIKKQIAVAYINEFSTYLYKNIINEFDTDEIITSMYKLKNGTLIFEQNLIKMQDFKFDLKLEIPEN